jgi:hypothetical protein
LTKAKASLASPGLEKTHKEGGAEWLAASRIAIYWLFGKREIPKARMGCGFWSNAWYREFLRRR